ncbi:MAG: hypothetical protein AAFP90_20760 [Planctomycetota bacterium]
MTSLLVINHRYMNRVVREPDNPNSPGDERLEDDDRPSKGNHAGQPASGGSTQARWHCVQ